MSERESKPEPRIDPPRRSACMDAAFRADLEKLRKMSAVERIALALRLGRRNIALDRMLHPDEHPR
jgi:hypothetical protein